MAMEGHRSALFVKDNGDAANKGNKENAPKNDNDEDEALTVVDARTLSPIEHVIPAFMMYLLEFMDLPTRINLASGSTTLSHLIYQQCSAVWVTIDLSTLPDEVKCLITDYMLAALLCRVDARNTTKFLVLEGCPNIRGNGIEPLRKSPVLERLTFDKYRSPASFNFFVSTNILRTMLPYSVTDVRLPFGVESGKWRQEFLLELRQTVHQRAIVRGTECTACHHPVRDSLHQIVPDKFGLPPPHCSICLKNFCRTGTCPAEVRDCNYCGVTSCGGCDNVKRCGGCHDIHCRRCDEFSGQCIYCKQVFCHEECSGFELTCVFCDKTVCTNCSELHFDRSIKACYDGENTHCSDCRKHLTCDRCHEVDCVKPDVEYVSCCKCSRLVCPACTFDEAECDECKTFACWNCAVYSQLCDAQRCEVCEKRFCDDCREVFWCPCGIALCSHHECVRAHSKECGMLRGNKKARTDEN